jgi:hypothetical protein
MTTKILTHDDYLKALALFVCAHEHYVKMRQFEAQLLQITGDDGCGYGGNVSDAIYTDDATRAADFDAALAKDSITVEPPVCTEDRR